MKWPVFPLTLVMRGGATPEARVLCRGNVIEVRIENGDKVPKTWLKVINKRIDMSIIEALATLERRIKSVSKVYSYWFCDFQNLYNLPTNFLA